MSDTRLFDLRTHYEGCWRSHGHHECAIAEVERLRSVIVEYRDAHAAFMQAEPVPADVYQARHIRFLDAALAVRAAIAPAPQPPAEAAVPEELIAWARGRVRRIFTEEDVIALTAARDFCRARHMPGHPRLDTLAARLGALLPFDSPPASAAVTPAPPTEDRQ